MTHNFINKIGPGTQLNDIYMVTQPVLRSTTRGDLYIAMFLSDRTGKLNARMWQATEELYNSLPKEGFIRIHGRSEVYQNALQIIINNISVVNSDDVPLEDYLPRTEKDIEQMFSGIKKIVSGIKNPDLKMLVDAFLADKELMKEFCTAPAAMTMHHNYLGGLIEHTANMLNVAVEILPLYPDVQADLVLAGIFLHDMGKTKELCYQMGFSYTDSGQLLGHIVQTTIMIDQKATELAGKSKTLDADIIANLQHIIVSHHGQYEFGSPKLPATAEAFMVSHLDNLDAKINQVIEVIENDPGNNDWTAWKAPLQTKLYKKRVTENKD